MQNELPPDNINNYVPSILNPRVLQKQPYFSLTQNSTISRCSLSLKRPNKLSTSSNLCKVNLSNIGNTSDKITHKKVNADLRTSQAFTDGDSIGFSAIEDLEISNKENAPVLRNCSDETFKLTLGSPLEKQVTSKHEDIICINAQKNLTEETKATKNVTKSMSDDISLGSSFIICSCGNNNNLFEICDKHEKSQERAIVDRCIEEVKSNTIKISELEDIETIKCHSSATDIDVVETNSESTILYDFNADSNIYERPIINVTFGVTDCENIDVTSKNSSLKRVSISRNAKNTDIDCEIIENSQLSTYTEVDENMNETSLSPRKRTGVTVNLQIKKQKLTQSDSAEVPKVLILKTNAIEKISHVIVQPPNYKFNITRKGKYNNKKSRLQNGNINSVGLKQVAIDSFFRQAKDAEIDCKQVVTVSSNDDGWMEMSRNSGVIDAAKCDRIKSARQRRDSEVTRPVKRELEDVPKSARLSSKRDLTSPPRQDVKTSNSDAPTPSNRIETTSANAPRRNVESLHFSLPVKCKSNKTSLSPRNIPQHKIVAGTHFAVDAFSYGEIPNVKHYFLTHFHSDHYCGLKKSFSKLLFCSKITADLCISRLGVNAKNIRIINVDEVLRIEGVEVTAVDANHCPGALMLIFTLPSGKTLLHTGDFRACPAMESYPVFWNKDIHTVYLDTTYCNPHYDFPTQDQSLEMALYILRQKKMALEKVGKKFSTVLIVCGTYTIGKEKFFTGVSRRVGCAVWACPEKERVLQIVEGRACTRDAPRSCQLHVVPMRDLTHEKLRSYLESLQGEFTEVVAFKPSGWENGKNTAVERDSVTIHGIPYSEHSSFSELIRFVKFLKPTQVVPTVDISGGVIKSVRKYFPCPLVCQEESRCQTRVTDYFSIHSRRQVPAVT